MDAQQNAAQNSAALNGHESNSNQPSLNPPRRVWNKWQAFVPEEKQTSKGTWVFRTTDKELYCRAPDGSIHHAQRKVNGKQARKARAAQRRSKG